MREMTGFWKSTSGQDTVEYALILGFIALAGAAAFLTMQSNTSWLWSTTNSRMAQNAPVITP